MAHLTWISDVHFESCVKAVLEAGLRGAAKAETDMFRNGLDPFSAVFDAACQGIALSKWQQVERQRQSQKTLQNAIGTFHQDILSGVRGWEKPADGYIDLVSPSTNRVAEIKNKHNTVKGSDLISVYRELNTAVNGKTSSYKGFTGYYVAVIPKSTKRYCEPFTPADNSTGTRATSHKHILQIDGYSFYSLATGRADALRELYAALPIWTCANCSR
jgi:hypothetical protein